MLLDPLFKSSPDELFIGQVKATRVAGFKLLGVHITSDLKWNTHILIQTSLVDLSCNINKTICMSFMPKKKLHMRDCISKL